MEIFNKFIKARKITSMLLLLLLVVLSFTVPGTPVAAEVNDVCTVTFHRNGGDTEAEPMSKIVPSGENIDVLPAPPTREGYIFTTWNTQDDGYGTEFTAETALTVHKTVYAQWMAAVPVILESIEITSLPDKNTYYIGEALDLTGLVVTGTYSDTSTALLAITMPHISRFDSSSTFTGQEVTITYEEKTATFTVDIVNIPIYTVTFDENGDETEAEPILKTAARGDNVDALPATPTREGYIFTGWNTQADGRGTVFTAETPVTGDITVYAQWAEVPATLESIEVTSQPDKITYYLDEELDLSGLVVTGLYSDNSAVELTITPDYITGFDSSAVVAGQAVTITYENKTTSFNIDIVDIEDVEPIQAFTVTFDKNGGDTEADPATKTLAPDENVNTLPRPPTWESYIFEGWNTQADGSGAEFTLETAVTADITVYAQWSEVSSTLESIEVTTPPNKLIYYLDEELDLSGLVVTGIYSDNSTVELAITPDHISGFYSSAAATGREVTIMFEDRTTTFTVDIIAVLLYTVTFDKNGGDSEADPVIKTIAPDENVNTLPSPPTRESYIFEGWNTQADGNGAEFTAETAVTADITVYAQWTPVITGSISGMVTDGVSPIAGAEVFLMVNDSVYSAITVKDGSYTIKGVPVTTDYGLMAFEDSEYSTEDAPPGTDYTIMAFKEGYYHGFAEDVTVEADTDTSLDIVLTAMPLTIKNFTYTATNSEVVLTWDSVSDDSIYSYNIYRKSEDPPPPDDCFIATAAYGSSLNHSVTLLRDFRDTYLANNKAGRYLIEQYYKYSPSLASSIKNSDALKGIARFALLPVIFTAFTAFNYQIVLVMTLLTLLLTYIIRKRRWPAQKIISLVLIFVLLTGMFPAQAFAQEQHNPVEGYDLIAKNLTETTYTDNGIGPGIAYRYIVSASSDDHEIIYSNPLEVTVPTTAVPVTMESIEVTNAPDKTTYYIGQSFDLTGLVVTGTYSDGSTAQLSITEEHISDFDSSEPATDQVVTITYENKTASFGIDIVSVTLESIEVTSEPAKTTYYLSQPLYLTGLVVTGTYSDGSAAQLSITEAHISGFDSSEPATGQEVTITYENKTASFSVDIVAVTLESIEVTNAPDKTTYYVGQSFDLAGLVVTGSYSDGSTAQLTITETHISGFESSEPATGQEVTITYENKTASFSVDIVAADKTITIATIPGVIAPVLGAAPVTTGIDTEEYKGTITWHPEHDPFEAETVYTANIVLIAKAGWTLEGVTENYFTIDGSPEATVSNPAYSSLITAVFPETSAPDQPEYIVTFVDHNGNVLEKETVKHGGDATAPDNPEREGYTFTGWDSSDLSNITSDLTITAQWTANTDTAYKVKHYTEYLYGTWELEDTENLTGTTGTLATATLNSYTGFSAPALAPSATIAGDGSTVIRVEYTRNSYTITFETDGGSTVDPVTAKYEADITPPADPTKEGHTFDGWLPALPSTMPAEDLTTTAQWEITIISTEAELTAALNDSEVTDILLDGVTLMDYFSAIVAGQTIVGTGIDNTIIDGNLTVVADNITIKDLTVTGTVTIAEGVETFTAEGTNFNELTINGGGSDSIHLESVFVDSLSINNPGVRVELKGSSRVEFLDLNAKGARLELKDHSSVAWLSVINDDVILVRGANAEVINIWHDWYRFGNFKEIEMIRVTYGVQAGEGEGSIVAMVDGKPISSGDEIGEDRKVSLTATPAAGYKIKHWIVDGSLSSLTGATYIVTDLQAHVDVKVEFEIIPDEPYTVIFKDYDGVLKVEEVDYSYNATAPADPVREGYTFTGWDKGFDYISTDLIVTAQYTVKEYTVTFVDWDGTELKVETVTHGNAATAPAVPERESYTFTGWDSDFSNVTTHLTVNARWEIPRISTEAELMAALNDSSITTIYLAGGTFTGNFSVTIAGQTIVGIGRGSTLIDGNLTVIADNITIKDIRVSSTVTVSEGVDTFTAERTSFSRLIINSGSNSTHLKSVSVNQLLEINKPGVRLELKGSSYVSDLSVNATGRVELKDQTWVEWLTIYADNVMLARGTGSIVNNIVDMGWYDIWPLIRVTFDVEAGKGSIAAMVDGTPIPSGDEIDRDKQIYFTATPDYGYRVKHWIVNGSPVSLTVPTYTVTHLQVPVDVKVEFEEIPTDLNYTVTFKDYDDTILKEDTVEYGGSATAPDDPAREGYTFTGWDQAFHFITSDLEIIAQYRIKQYTVTFMNYDGTVLEPRQQVNHGGSATAPWVHEAVGATIFVGWDLDFSNVTEDLTITPQYELRKYTITFVDHDGTVLKTEIVEHGSDATAPDVVPEREGYTFNSWDYPLTSITVDLTITAIYQINMYNVRFYNYNRTILKESWIAHGSSATAPADPVREGYAFIGWDKDFTNVTEFLEVTAQYEVNNYTVTFLNWDGTELKTESVEFGSGATAPAAPVRESYTFTGWDKPFTYIRQDMTVTAQYNTSDYLVTFVDFDGSPLKNESVEHGGSVSAPSTNYLYRWGYTFIGWDKAFDNITENLTVTAQYEINEYTVTFTDFDGTVLKTEIVEFLKGATPPDDPVRVGYTFFGWDREFWGIRHDLMVTAEYEISKYTVIFKDHNDTILKEEIVEHGSSAAAPAEPAREGHTFTGWDVALDNVTSNLTITAQYSTNQYTVTFNSFFGISVPNQVLNYGSKIIEPPPPTFEGYTFVGWYKQWPYYDVNLWVFDQDIVPAANITLYGRWVINEYTLTYRAGINGSVSRPSVQTVRHGFSGNPVTAEPDAGYHFVSWSDGVTANPRRDTSVTADITVTAEFAITEYTVTFKNHAGSVLKTETLTHGSAATAPALSEREGYIFTGWDKAFNDVTNNLTVVTQYEAIDYTLAINYEYQDGTLAAAAHEETLNIGDAYNVTSPLIDGYIAGQVVVSGEMPAGNVSITVIYTINQYTLTYEGGPNGSLGGDTSQTVSHGSTGTPVEAIPMDGYHFVSWSDGVTANPRIDTNVTVGIYVAAEFAVNQYTLTYTAGVNGSIVGDTAQTMIHGSNGTEVIAIPNDGYHFVRWSDGVTANPRTDINASVSVTAEFAINQYNLTYTAGSNGSIVGNTEQTVNHGSAGTSVEAVPETNYHFVRWGDGVTANPRTDIDVTSGISVTAEFAINDYTLTYTAGDNGAIIGFSQQTVAHVSNGTEVIAIPNVGYHFVKWSDGITTDARTDIDVTAGISVTAEFAINQYTLIYTAGAKGSVVGDTEQTITHGSNGTEITAVPEVGYHFVKWSDGVTANPRTDIDVTRDITALAVFAINKYHLTYTAGANGTIAGDAEQTVEIGSNGTEVTAVPGVGYYFVKWSDGVTTASRTDSNITADTAVSAEFAINEYTVTFMDYDGTILKEETLTHGSSIIAPADPERSGFVGWSRPFNHITEDLTIIAIYEDMDALINDLAYLRFMALLEAGYTDPQAVEALEEDERFELNTNIAYVFALLHDGHLRAGPAMLSLNKEENIIIDFLRSYNQLSGTKPGMSFSVIFNARETAHELGTYYSYSGVNLLYALLDTNSYGILEVMDAMVVGVTSPMVASQAADALKRYGVSLAHIAGVLKNIYALSGQGAANELRAGNFTGPETAQVLMDETTYNITGAGEALQILTEAGFGLPAKVTVLKELFGKDLSATILLLNNAGYLDYGANPLVMRDRLLLFREAYETSAVHTMEIIREEVSPEYTQQLAADMFPLMLGIGFGGYSSKITGYLNMGFLLYEDVAYAFAENFIDSNHNAIGRAMQDLGYDKYDRAMMYKYLYLYYGDKLTPDPIRAVALMGGSTLESALEMLDLLERVFEWDYETIGKNLKQIGAYFNLYMIVIAFAEYYEGSPQEMVAMMLSGGYSNHQIYVTLVYSEPYRLIDSEDNYETAGLVLRAGGFDAMMVADAIEKRYFSYNAPIGSRYTARALVGADFGPSDIIDALYSRYSSLGLNKLYHDLYLAGLPIHQYSPLLGERFGYNAEQSAYYIAMALDMQPGYWRKRDLIAADLLEQLLNAFQLDYAEAIQIILEMDELQLYMGRFRLIEDISYAWYKNLADHNLAAETLHDMEYTLDQIATFLRYYNVNYDNSAKPETAFRHIGSTSLETADRLRRYFNYSMDVCREALWAVGYPAGEIVLAMLTHYHVSDESAARDMKEKGITTSEIAAILMDIYDIDFTTMTQVLWMADFTATELALFLRDDPLYHYDDVQVAQTLRASWFTGFEVTYALIAAYDADSVRIAEVLMLEEVNYMPLEIAMIMRSVFDIAEDAAQAVQIYIDAGYSAGVVADIFHTVYEMEQFQVAQFLLDADYSLEEITRGIRIAYELELSEYIGLLRDLVFSLPEIAVSLWSMATRYTDAVRELYSYDYVLTDIVDAMRQAYILSEVSRSDIIDLTGILAADIDPVEAAAAIYGVYEYESSTDFARVLFSAGLSLADIMLSLEEMCNLDLDHIFITMNRLGSEPLILATTAGEVWEDVTAQEVSGALHMAGVSVTGISSILLELYGQDSLITAVYLAKEAGVTVESVVTIIRDTFNGNLDDAVMALEEAGFALMEAALALQQVYSVDNKTLGVALSRHWFKDDNRYLNTALFFIELELDSGEIGEILVLAEGGSPEFVQERVADLKHAGFQLLEVTEALSQILPTSQLTYNISNVAYALQESYILEERIFALQETFSRNWNEIFAALRGDHPQTVLDALIIYADMGVRQITHGDIAAIMFADGHWSVSDIALLLKEEYELDAGATISAIETAGYADDAGSTERAAYYAQAVIRGVYGYEDINKIIGILKSEGYAAYDVAEWLKAHTQITSLEQRLEVLDESGYTIYDLMEVFQSSGLSQGDMLISMLNLYPLMDVIISMIKYLNLSDEELTQLLIDAQTQEGDIDEALAQLAQLEELDIILTIASMKKEAGANAFEMATFLMSHPINMEDHQEIIKFLHDLGYTLLAAIRATGVTAGFNLNYWWAQSFKDIYEYMYPKLRGLFTYDEMSDYEIIKLAMVAFPNEVGLHIRDQQDILRYLLTCDHDMRPRAEDTFGAMWEVWIGKNFYQFYYEIIRVNSMYNLGFTPTVINAMIIDGELGFASEKEIFFSYYDSSPYERLHTIAILRSWGLTKEKLIEYFIIEKWNMNYLDAFNFLWEAQVGDAFEALAGAYDMTTAELTLEIAVAMKARGRLPGQIYDYVQTYLAGDLEIQIRILKDIHGLNVAEIYQFVVSQRRGDFGDTLDIIKNAFNYSPDTDMLMQIVTNQKDEGLTTSNIADYLYMTTDKTKEEIYTVLENIGFSHQQAQQAVANLERLDIYDEEELIIFSMVWSLKQMKSSIHDISYHVAVQLKKDDPMLMRNILLDNGYTESEILASMYQVESLLKFTEEDLLFIPIVSSMKDRGMTAKEVALYLHRNTFLNMNEGVIDENLYKLVYILNEVGYHMEEVLEFIESSESPRFGRDRVHAMIRVYLEIYPEVFMADLLVFLSGIIKSSPNNAWTFKDHIMRLMVDELFPHLTLGDLHKMLYDNHFYPVEWIYLSMGQYVDDDTVMARLRDVNMTFTDARHILQGESLERQIYWYHYNKFSFHTEYGPYIMSSALGRVEYPIIFNLFRDIADVNLDEIAKMLNHWRHGGPKAIVNASSAIEYLYYAGVRDLVDFIHYAPIATGRVGDYNDLVYGLAQFNSIGVGRIGNIIIANWSDYDIIVEVYRSGATMMEIARAITNLGSAVPWMKGSDIYWGLRAISPDSLEQIRSELGDFTSAASRRLTDTLPLIVMREAGLPIDVMIEVILRDNYGWGLNVGGYRKVAEYLTAAGYSSSEVYSAIRTHYETVIKFDITLIILKKFVPPPFSKIFTIANIITRLIVGDVGSVIGPPSIPFLPW